MQEHKQVSVVCLCQMVGGRWQLAEYFLHPEDPELPRPLAVCRHEGLTSSRNCLFLCCVPGFQEGDRGSGTGAARRWDSCIQREAWGLGGLPVRSGASRRALRDALPQVPQLTGVLSTSEASLARQMERKPSHWGGQDARVAVSLTQARLSVPRAGRDSGTFLDREGAGPWVRGWDLTLRGCSLHQCLCFALHVGPVLSCCTKTLSPVGNRRGSSPKLELF